MLRTLLLKLSESKRLKAWMMRNALAQRVVARFVAGGELADALRVSAQLHAQGFATTLDCLGEHVYTRSGAERTKDEYAALLAALASQDYCGNISLKLTKLGLTFDQDLCRSLLTSLVKQAAEHNMFVRVDMEHAECADSTLHMVKNIHAKFPGHIGPVIQAYLYCSEKDLCDFRHLGCRVRLCKGAYRESPRVAFPHKKDVDRNFVRLMRLLLASGTFHGIATHDPQMIAEAIRFSEHNHIAKDAFEFQMLYGIRKDLAKNLVAMGYRVRIYVPYGEAWYPYFMRRLAERPANVFFFLKNLLR